MTVAEIMPKLTEALVNDLNLEDVGVEDITPDMPLFGEGLGLDSIDAVELVVLVEKHFRVAINDIEESKEAFASVRTLAEYIAARAV